MMESDRGRLTLSSNQDSTDPEDGRFEAVLAALSRAPSVQVPLKPGDVIDETFRIARQIGSGGMGVVYAAHDLRRDREVALKTLRLLSADQILRFKNEFRALQDLHHPNLVILGELMEVRGLWFFSMELIEGVDFLAYVRPDSREADPARLRGSLGQLAEAITAVHAAGKVHRDVKPSNVLVTGEGRTVVLDFGLVADIGVGDPLGDQVAVGTARYMAPEQAAGRAVGPAADWYAVGVMLHEALTGTPPFSGSAMEVLLAKQAQPAPDAEALAAAHGPLGRLCAELLRVEPEARAGIAAVRAALREAASAGVESIESATADAVEIEPAIEQAPFVGRGRELAALGSALDRVRAGQPALVHIEGDSGIGKSALVRQFLAIAGGRATVLAGRCYERELVPFKAIDGLVDALTRHLRRLPEAEAAALLPADADLLSRLFPVTEQVRAIRRVAPTAATAIDAQEVRARAFAALHQLLGRLAAVRPLVLFVDDLQWSDADSLVLLEQLARGPRPVPALLIVTARPGWPAPAWLAGEPAVHLHLGGLERADAQELMHRLIEQSDAAPAVPEGFEIRIDGAAGHPLFLAELVRHSVATAAAAAPAGADGAPISDLSEALWRRVTRLDTASRGLLETIAVAGAALPLDLAIEAAGLGGDRAAWPQAALRANHLLRTAPGAGDGEQRVDTYHDVVRELIRVRMPDGARRARHRALAVAAGAEAVLGPDMLALHWQEAGEPAEAARWARIGGERALAQLAFDHAARLFQLALDLLPGGEAAARRPLLEGLAQSLAYAGRGRQAATTYLAAAALADGAPAIELQRKAAEQFLLTGYVDDGRAVLRSVVAATGLRMPTSELRALLKLLVRRFQLTLRGRRPRLRAQNDASDAPDPAELTRIDVCYAATSGLVAIDPLRSSYFLSEGLLRALRAGEPMRLGRAMAFDISFLAATRGPDHRTFHRARARAQALADQLGDPRVQALIDGNAGAAALLGGRWQESVDLCSTSERTVRERCVGFTWELDVIELVSLTALWYMGRLADLVQEVPRRLRDACERGDRFSATNLRSGLPFAAWLVSGQTDEAAAELATARGDWSQEDFYVQHAQLLHADVLLALYRGDATGAAALLAAAEPAMGRTLLDQILLHRILMTDLRGRVALAQLEVAGVASGERRRLLRIARRSARRLGRERVPWGRALAALLRAELAAADGDEEASADFASAEAVLRDCGMALHAEVAARRRGQLRGDPAIVAASDAWLEAQGVASPGALASLLAPASTPGRWR
jgi:eukaryotic-like serine/threonine-protein kinase